MPATSRQKKKTAKRREGRGEERRAAAERRLTEHLKDVRAIACSPDIAAQRSHYIVLHTDGTVSTVGNNTGGQLGLGDSVHRNAPDKVRGVADVVAVATGDRHTLLLHADGTVSAAGNNMDGELGLGHNAPRPSPAKIPGVRDVRAIAAGCSHSALLHTDGTVSTFGWNMCGQLGLRDTENRNAPEKIPDLTDARAIATGRFCTLVLHKDATVSICGNNEEGGAPSADDAKNKNVIALTKIPGLVDVRAMSYSTHGLFVHDDGTVSALGDNAVGKYRSSPEKLAHLTDVRAVAVQWWGSVVLHRDRTISVIGLPPSTSNRWFHPLRECLGCSRYGKPKRVPGLTNVKAVFTSWQHVFVLHRNDTVSFFGGFGHRGHKRDYPGLGTGHILRAEVKKAAKPLRKRSKPTFITSAPPPSASLTRLHSVRGNFGGVRKAIL